MDLDVVDTSMEVDPQIEPAVEKTLTQSKVNEIVQREKIRAAEKAREEVKLEYAKKMEDMQLQQLQAQQAPQAPQGQPGGGGMGGMAGFDPEQIKQQIMQQIMGEQRKAQEDAQRAQHQADMEKVAGNFYAKMGAGKELYPDFEDVTGSFTASAFPQVVFLAAEMENTPDIMYELAKNPGKLATIDYLAQRDPMAAKNMLSKLSDSISQNQQAAANMKNTNAPLSRMKSSTVGADNGVMDVNDYKKVSWLRG